MTTFYDLYGTAQDDPAAAAAALSTALAVVFEERESAYQGVYGSAGSPDGERFILKRNVDPFDDEPAEADFPDFRVLLYVDEVDDADRAASLREAIEQAAMGFRLLRSERL